MFLLLMSFSIFLASSIAMQPLNFPAFKFRIKNSEKGTQIFDIVRRKFVVLQPEEWVRQHVIHFLHHQKNTHLSLIGVEQQIKLNKTLKRTDVAIYNKDGSVFLLVECKAPQISIDQEVFDQIARYNVPLKSQYLMVTNGWRIISVLWTG